MDAENFLQKARSPEAWRKHAKALRRAADALWEVFAESVFRAARLAREKDVKPDMTIPMEDLMTAKLLYGLALETSLKATIVETSPKSIEFQVTMDGTGAAVRAELRNIGVASHDGHNLLRLADQVGLFGDGFKDALPKPEDAATMKNICRDLGEAIVWRGRYPIPLKSFTPQSLDPSVPPAAVAHYLRDWLAPVLDKLLYGRVMLDDAGA